MRIVSVGANAKRPAPVARAGLLSEERSIGDQAVCATAMPFSVK